MRHTDTSGRRRQQRKPFMVCDKRRFARTLVPSLVSHPRIANDDVFESKTEEPRRCAAAAAAAVPSLLSQQTNDTRLCALCSMFLHVVGRCVGRTQFWGARIRCLYTGHILAELKRIALARAPATKRMNARKEKDEGKKRGENKNRHGIGGVGMSSARRLWQCGVSVAHKRNGMLCAMNG